MADLEPYTMEGFALCSFWRIKKLHCNFPNLREAVGESAGFSKASLCSAGAGVKGFTTRTEQASGQALHSGRPGTHFHGWVLALFR